MGVCCSSNAAVSKKAQANKDSCEKTFKMQIQMAKGAVDEAMLAKFSKEFAGFFASSFEFAANPKASGPKVTGSFQEVMEAIAPIWLGFKNTRIENKSFAVKEDNVIAVSQVYDHHLTDASGVEIPGTANKGMEVTQIVTYDADGKISKWVQEYDAPKVQSSRNMAACRETFAIQVKMAMGEVDESMLAEFGAKFAEFFAPKFDMSVNPKASGPKVTSGTFVEAMGLVSPIWMGFKNTSIENKSFVAKRDGAIEVAQVFEQHLTDASGAKVAGTDLKTEVLQTVTYADGKISSWVTEFDMSKVQAAREAHIMSLCKETCEAQAQLAMGSEVNEEMLAKFGKEFASSFTDTFEMVVNPQIPGRQVIGTFNEVMEVVGPMWIGFKTVKHENQSFSVKDGNAVLVSQVWHQQLMDKSGQEVPGAYHILEMQTTYTYTNGKISKLVQEFDPAKVEASRKVAAKVAELTEGAPKVETLVEDASPKPEPTGCGWICSGR